MYAAVVTAFDSPPSYQEFAAPVPDGPHQVLVDVIATGLHPRVRSQADGSHYTSTGRLPLVPGIDGVGRLPDGRLAYFILPDTAVGAMAQQTVVDRRRSIVLADDADPIRIAAAMNPAMSSWLALQGRIAFQPGQDVLILGATGSAGQLAIQVAKLLGAGRVIAAGRRQSILDTLPGFGADVVVGLEGEPDDVFSELGRTAAEADVVLDYLWGRPAAAAMTALVTARPDPGKALWWIQIGSVAGSDAPIPSAALRAANVQIVGSGQGSLDTSDILAALPALAKMISDGTLQVDAVAIPLSEVGTAWTMAAPAGRPARRSVPGGRVNVPEGLLLMPAGNAPDIK